MVWQWRGGAAKETMGGGDSHRKPMEFGGGHPVAHRDRPLPLSAALSRVNPHA